MSLWSSFWICRAPALAFGLLGLYWGAFSAQVPVLKLRIGAGDAEFGTLMLASALGIVSAMALAPRIDPRLGRYGMLIALLLTSVAFLLPGLAKEQATFALAMLVAGFGAGLTDILMNARVSEVEGRSRRSLMNINHAIFSLFYAIAALATGVAREIGMTPFEVFLGVAVVTWAFGWLALMAPEQAGTGSGAGGSAPTLFVVAGGAIVLIAFMSENTVEGWSALHIERTLGGRYVEGALGPATLGFTMAFGRLMGQVVAHRFSEIRVIFFASFLSAAGAFVAALAPEIWVAYLGFGLLGLGVSVIGPMALALVGKSAPPGSRTRTMSRTAVIGFSGFFIGPFLMGMTSEYFGLSVAFGVTGLVLLMTPVLLVPWQRPVDD